MSLNYGLTDESLSIFNEKYSSRIHKETDDRIYMKCIWKAHGGGTDKVCAVLYKDTGVYSCPVCGNCHVSQLIEGVKTAPRLITPKQANYTWNFKQFPLHYEKTLNGNIYYVNADKNGVITGSGERINSTPRQYNGSGKPGFRLFAPVITESLSEAILLLENGINAGSICGVNNIRNCRSTVFLPQNDSPSREAVKSLCPTTIALLWFSTQPTAKDIRELDKNDLQGIINNLQSFKL